jgi:hypothetical protein
MNRPLNNIFRNCDSSRSTGKWAMELLEHVIDFEKRSAIKSQVLGRFRSRLNGVVKLYRRYSIETPWQVYCDGA